MSEHWFWFMLTIACVGWYSSITILVTVRGFSDIKGMLKRLAADQPPEAGGGSAPEAWAGSKEKP